LVDVCAYWNDALTTDIATAADRNRGAHETLANCGRRGTEKRSGGPLYRFCWAKVANSSHLTSPFYRGCGIDSLQCVGRQLANLGNGVLQGLDQDWNNNLRLLRIVPQRNGRIVPHSSVGVLHGADELRQQGCLFRGLLAIQ